MASDSETKNTDQEQPITPQPTVVEDPSAEPDVEEPEVDEAPVVEENDRPVRPMKGSQRRRSLAEMSKRPDWLPDGWGVVVTRRKKGDTKGAYDQHYISPSGVKYRSKIAVEAALRSEEEESGNPNAPAATSGGESADPANKRQRTEDEDATDANSKKVS